MKKINLLKRNAVRFSVVLVIIVLSALPSVAQVVPPTATEPTPTYVGPAHPPQVLKDAEPLSLAIVGSSAGDTKLVASSAGSVISGTVSGRTVSMAGVRFPSEVELSEQQPETKRPTTSSSLVDNWYQRGAEIDFQRGLPLNCTVSDLNPNDGKNWSWGVVTTTETGTAALWAVGSIASTDLPGTNNYPPNVSTRVVCGPYDLRSDEKVLVKFRGRVNLADAGDHFFVGFNENGSTTTATVVDYAGPVNTTGGFQILFSSAAGKSNVYVVWGFESDASGNAPYGAWIDDITVNGYRSTPEVASCGTLNPGSKGLGITPIDPRNTLFIGNPTDTSYIDDTVATGTNWVRLGLNQLGQGAVDLMAYDRVIDTFCTRKIAVLGLVNNETIFEGGYNDDATAATYRTKFAELCRVLALHYKGRISTWEIWNESSSSESAFVTTQNFAPLLSAASLAIKSSTPNAKTIFGGTPSAWRDSQTYVNNTRLQNEVTWFNHDHQGVHPYTDGEGRPGLHGLDPSVYLKAADQKDSNEITIVDKFIPLSPSGKIWATELGWDASKGSATSPPCTQQAVTTSSQQSQFLKRGFDVLLNDVPNRAVSVVFYFQLSDFAYARCNSDPKSYDQWFGLYTLDKPKRKKKEAFCQFLSYPASPSPDCLKSQTQVFLPAVTKSLAVGTR